MNQKAAQIISIVLHPAWVPLLSAVAIFHYCPFLVLAYEPVKSYVFLLIAIFTIIGPIASVFLLYKSGYIKDIRIPARKERPIPLLLATVYHCILTYFTITKMEGMLIVSSMMLSVSFTLSLLTIISSYYKISIHTAGYSGAIGFFLSMRFFYPNYPIVYPLVFAFLLCGVVMTARLALKAHTVKEVWSGFGVGLFSCFSVNSLLLLVLY